MENGDATPEGQEEYLIEKEAIRVDYIKNIKLAMIADNKRPALKRVIQAIEEFPDDPLFLSYYGYLIGTVEENIVRGAKICRDAISTVELFPEKYEGISPLLFLNLGKVYLLSNRKKEAVIAFQRGLKKSPKDVAINREIKKMGLRGTLPIPFLNRSNPLNKYIGIYLQKLRNKK